jgi:predicted solute-binding protein
MYLAPGQVDITPIVENRAKKPGRKTTSTQAQSWEAVEADFKRFSQIECVYSFLLANQQTSYSRRQLEERLKMRAGNLTSILKQLQEQKQVGIEKQDICEYTGQSVYFYYAIEIKQVSQFNDR